jgi:hypothetical protein
VSERGLLVEREKSTRIVWMRGLPAKMHGTITPLKINDFNTTPISTDLKKYLFTPPHNIDVDFERV